MGVHAATLAVERDTPTLATPFDPQYLRRNLLSASDGVPVAIPPVRLPAVANGLLPLPALSACGGLAPAPCDITGGRTRTWRSGPEPSAAIMDAQSVKTVEESAGISGYDGHKRVRGRKRQLLVDTLGLPLSIWVTRASIHDKVDAGCVLAGLKALVPRLAKSWAD